MDLVKVSTEAIKQCVCWNNVFDLAAGQQQVLGRPAWSCCSLPALICRPGISLPFLVSFPPISSLSPFFLAFVPLSPSSSLCFFSLLSFAFSLSFSLSASLLLHILAVKEPSCTPATHLLDLNDTTGCRSTSASLNLCTEWIVERKVVGLGSCKQGNFTDSSCWQFLRNEEVEV